MRMYRATRTLFDTVRELDLEQIEREIDRPIRILVVGRDPARTSSLIDGLFDLDGTSPAVLGIEEISLAPGVAPGRFPTADLVLVILTAGVEPAADEAAAVAQLQAIGVPTVLVFDHLERVSLPHDVAERARQAFPAVPDEAFVYGDSGDLADLRARILAAVHRLAPSMLLALGRRFPALRPSVTDVLIQETSKANAQFALLSSIPALIPLAGGLIGNVADLVILTKNQAILVFKLAGIYGRGLRNRLALVIEIAPVVGGAFAWRTVARSLVALFPAALSAVPKAAVAYVGTFVVGQLASYYYQHGNRPTAALADRFRREGLRLARRFVHL